MSMSVRDAETGLEWAGALGASGLFPTRSNLRNPRYLRMLTEIRKGNIPMVPPTHAAVRGVKMEAGEVASTAGETPAPEGV